MHAGLRYTYKYIESLERHFCQWMGGFGELRGGMGGFGGRGEGRLGDAGRVGTRST